MQVKMYTERRHVETGYCTITLRKVAEKNNHKENIYFTPRSIYCIFFALDKVTKVPFKLTSCGGAA